MGSVELALCARVWRAARERGVFLAAAAIAIAACRSGTKEETLALSEFGRDYRIVTRSAHDGSHTAPVLFALHAFGVDPKVMEQRYRLVSAAVLERGYILVVPEGLSDSKQRPFWNATRACCDADGRAPDDLRYLKAVLADVRRRYAVDTKRVYAFGISNGAFMAHRWACEPGGDVTKIVALAGTGPSKEDPPCSPTAPVSVLQIHGDADEVVAYGGGSLFAPHPGVRETVDRWRRRAECNLDVPPLSKPRPDLFELPAVARVWSCKRGNVAVWTVNGGPHDLPETKRLIPAVFEFLDGP